MTAKRWIRRIWVLGICMALLAGGWYFRPDGVRTMQPVAYIPGEPSCVLRCDAGIFNGAALYDWQGVPRWNVPSAPLVLPYMMQLLVAHEPGLRYAISPNGDYLAQVFGEKGKVGVTLYHRGKEVGRHRLYDFSLFRDKLSGFSDPWYIRVRNDGTAWVWLYRKVPTQAFFLRGSRVMASGTLPPYSMLTPDGRYLAVSLPSGDGQFYRVTMRQQRLIFTKLVTVPKGARTEMREDDAGKKYLDVSPAYLYLDHVWQAMDNRLYWPTGKKQRISLCVFCSNERQMIDYYPDKSTGEMRINCPATGKHWSLYAGKHYGSLSHFHAIDANDDYAVVSVNDGRPPEWMYNVCSFLRDWRLPVRVPPLKTTYQLYTRSGQLTAKYRVNWICSCCNDRKFYLSPDGRRACFVDPERTADKSKRIILLH